MKCPACENTLTRICENNVELDVCNSGCGGIWFDQFELKKFDEPDEQISLDLLWLERNPSVSVDHGARRDCPKCSGIVMMRHFFSAKHEVEVDECPSCGSYWLDAGELRSIRNQYSSEEERRAAVDDYFEHVFGEELPSLKIESEEKERAASTIERLFSAICPTAYRANIEKWIDNL